MDWKIIGKIECNKDNWRKNCSESMESWFLWIWLWDARDKFWHFFMLTNLDSHKPCLLPENLHKLYINLKVNFPEYFFENWRFYDEKFFTDAIWEYLEEILSSYKVGLIDSNIHAWWLMLTLWNIFENMFIPVNSNSVSFKNPLSSRKYRYISKVGNGSSPFYSDFIAFWLLDKEYKEFCMKYRYAINFFRIILSDFIAWNAGEKWWEIYICDKNNIKRKAWESIKRSDILVYSWSKRGELKMASILWKYDESLALFTTGAKFIQQVANMEREEIA